MRLLLLLALAVGCSSNPPTDPCDDWTWIDDESCSADVCGEQGAEEYECRDGDCWCCQDGNCWRGR